MQIDEFFEDFEKRRNVEHVETPLPEWLQKQLKPGDLIRIDHSSRGPEYFINGERVRPAPNAEAVK